MDREERTDRVLRAIEATVSGDTSGVAELFTPDVVARSPTLSVSSRVELAVELEDQEDGFSEVEVRPGPFVVDGDQICTEWVATALHSPPLAPGEGWTRDSTDRRVTLRGVTVAEFAGDQICIVRHYWDEGERRLELGLPLPDRARPRATRRPVGPSSPGRRA